MKIALEVEKRHLDPYEGNFWTTRCPIAKALSEICEKCVVTVRANNFSLEVREKLGFKEGFKEKWITLPLPREVSVWVVSLDLLLQHNLSPDGLFPRVFVFEIPDLYIFYGMTDNPEGELDDHSCWLA